MTELPKGWKDYTLKDLTQNIKHPIVDGPFGTQMKVKDFFKEGIPVIEMQNIKDDVFSTEFRRFISINLFDKLIRSKVKSEDIILSKTGSLGKIAIIPENFNKGIITSRLAKISLDKSKINLKYVYYFLIFFRKLGLWEKLGKGSTMKVLTIKKIANVNIPTPSLEEQSLIVEKIEQELTRLESAVNSLNNLKNKLKVYRQSVLKAAFEGKLINSFSKWENESFSKCFKHISPGKIKIKQKDYLKEGKIPIIDQGQDLIGGYSNNTLNIQNIELPVIIFGDHTRRFKFINFTFAIGADGTKILKVNDTILNNKFAFYQCLILKLPNKGYSRHFQYLEKTILKFPKDKIEQEQIVSEIESRFSVIDKIEVVVENALLKAEKLKMSILKSAFEGKLVKGVEE